MFHVSHSYICILFALYIYWGYIHISPSLVHSRQSPTITIRSRQIGPRIHRSLALSTLTLLPTSKYQPIYILFAHITSPRLCTRSITPKSLCAAPASPRSTNLPVPQALLITVRARTSLFPLYPWHQRPRPYPRKSARFMSSVRNCNQRHHQGAPRACWCNLCTIGC